MRTNRLVLVYMRALIVLQKKLPGRSLLGTVSICPESKLVGTVLIVEDAGEGQGQRPG